MAFIQDRFKPDSSIDPELFSIRENFIQAVAQNFRQTPPEHFSTSGWGPNIDQFAHVSSLLNVSWADWINMDLITQRALFDTVNHRIEQENREKQKSSKELEMKLKDITETRSSPFEAIKPRNFF